MDKSSEIKLLKAKVALLEVEKKHLTQKLTSLEKYKTYKPTPNVIASFNPPEGSHHDVPIEQIIQLLKNTFESMPFLVEIA